MSINTSKSKKWLSSALTVLAVGAFVMSGAMKVAQSAAVVEGFARVGIPTAAVVPLGLVELVCAALYVYPRTVVLGSLLLTGYLGGAILANLIVRNGIAMPIAVGVVLWAATWLRVAELRELLPLQLISRTRGVA